jgi:hypothetical protein
VCKQPSGNKRLMSPARKADDPRRRKLVVALSLMSCAILGSVVMVGWEFVTEGLFSGRDPAASPPSHPSGAVFSKPEEHITTAMLLVHIHELATSELDGAGTPEAGTPIGLPRADGPLHETCALPKNSTTWPEAKARPARFAIAMGGPMTMTRACAGAKICRVRAP